MVGPDELQLLTMDEDRQQPASLQRERLITCSSLSQPFPGRAGNTEPSQKENTADVGNKEKQQVTTRLPLPEDPLVSSWIFLQQAKKKLLYSSWSQQRCFSLLLPAIFFKLRCCCRSSKAGSAQNSSLILCLSLIASCSL